MPWNGRLVPIISQKLKKIDVKVRSLRAVYDTPFSLIVRINQMGMISIFSQKIFQRFRCVGFAEIKITPVFHSKLFNSVCCAV